MVLFKSMKLKCELCGQDDIRKLTKYSFSERISWLCADCAFEIMDNFHPVNPEDETKVMKAIKIDDEETQ